MKNKKKNNNRTPAKKMKTVYSTQPNNDNGSNIQRLDSSNTTKQGQPDLTKPTTQAKAGTIGFTSLLVSAAPLELLFSSN